jgi:hypothetical protein
VDGSAVGSRTAAVILGVAGVLIGLAGVALGADYRGITSRSYAIAGHLYRGLVPFSGYKWSLAATTVATGMAMMALALYQSRG